MFVQMKLFKNGVISTKWIKFDKPIQQDLRLRIFCFCYSLNVKYSTIY